ncbi:type II toxin-antitoxin system VapC family toxin [Dolichospermum sp. UHCC 0352]|uniref:type II toxin-antitoxin system VapC family toxin n=1 Tax=Dolichospermum sp. UHCC 0352 TaxID=2590011 RepID=UPI00144882F6|nr:type II toxin-antitoxin system VapC family toxin [Dolichospermum sp. UHCC 0352]MTJ21584.1 type II toxin-antitoxin system VapC family toxin [Dolichospermum sp. UHCC 0352]
MSLWILDTDHVSLFQHRNPLIVQCVNSVKFEEIAITIITAEEQLRGRFNVIRNASSSDKLVLAYANFQNNLDFLQSVNLLEFSEAAGNIYTELVKQKIRVGTQDLRIAAITLSVKGILVTRNFKDFEKVPNLRLEDWSIS